MKQLPELGHRPARTPDGRANHASGRRIACLAAALTAALAAPAAASTYPSPGGSSFNSGPQGWAGNGDSCTVIGSPTSLCAADNSFAGGEGNPPGSIATRTRVLVNALGLFRGSGSWRSPSFTAAGPDRGGALQYDRQLDVGGLLDLAPSARVQPMLVDDSSGVARNLSAETLTPANATFATRSVPVAALVPGRRYHIELRSTTTTTLARVGLLGDAHVRYDNVRLFVNDTPGSPGVSFPGGPASPGVSYPGSPISSIAFRQLASTLSVWAEFGRNAGGTLVPLRSCTILGTPGNDVINGSTGNDVICGLGGRDIINGDRGSDIIDGGNGNDRLSGARAGDLLLALRGRDRADGGAGNDEVGGGAGPDSLSGWTGDDLLVGASGGDWLGGNAGRDRLRGASGNDRLVGGLKFDRLWGGAGRDRLEGGPGGDRLLGERGNDRLSGGRGRDGILGGPGSDRFQARDRTRDLVDGGRGRDRATVDLRFRVGARRADRVRRVERIIG